MKSIHAVLERRVWVWLTLVIGLALVGCAVPLIQTPTPAAPEATAAAEAAEPTATPAAAVAPVVATESFKDLPVGFTAEGYPFRGAPDAPITIYEYSDYGCPFCARYYVQTEPALDDSFVRTNQVRVVFRDFPLVQLHPNAPAAHVAALCVAEQGSAATFWEMHDEIFATQTVWTNLSNPQPHLVRLAERVGVDMARFEDCVASGAMDAAIEQSLAEGQSLGVTGTPTFNFVREATSENFLLVGAQPYEQFAGLVTALVAGETPTQQPEAQGDPQIPLWATTEGLAPDPARPGYTLAGDLYRGNPDADVVVIEFSDFQCPFCRRHVQETQPALDEEFVATDQVMWVFKHFPLAMHPQAEAAGVAAECAGDQQQFWQMHDLLFEHVEQWSVSDPASIFSGFAEELGLDLEQFNACAAGSEALARVQQDLNDGLPFVQGTPTFIVLFNGDGRIIPGALPADRFSEALQQIIDTTAQ